MKEQWAAAIQQTVSGDSCFVSHDYFHAVGLIHICTLHNEMCNDKTNTMTRRNVIDFNFQRQMFIYQIRRSCCVFRGSASLHCPSVESTHQRRRDPEEGTPGITSENMKEERLKRNFVRSPLWRAERGINLREGMGVERLGSRRHITKYLLVATDAVHCAAVSVYYSPLLPEPTVSSRLYPFSLA